MTVGQWDSVRKLLEEFQPIELHHGDCVGADADVDALASGLFIHRVIHPPAQEVLRAFCRSTEMREPKDYLARNRDIVDESDVLLVCPRDYDEKQRSGTWSTKRYAVKQGKPVIVIWPNGEVKR
jgi:hypothetical protein